MSSVSLERLSKSYGQTNAVRDLNLEIEDGTFVVLVGPSGCGKSTLLRMIAGLEEISEGEIRIGGTVVNELAPRDRNVAMVFQSYALYPHKTVRDNLAFSFRMRRVPKKEAAVEVAKVAELLGIEALLDRYPSQLSGGQRQRVAMGRAIVRNPAVFLFDEPLSNLDAELRVRMRGEIRALHKRLGATTIYVTHDQIEAMTMADRIVIMRDGLVEQQATPTEVYDHPANTFVASFIGAPAMNLMPATVRDGNVEIATMNGPAIVGKAPDVPPGAVILGVRPEDLSLDPDGFAAEVLYSERPGAETHIIATVGDSRMIAVARDKATPASGEQVRLKAERGRIHLFDRETGLHL